MGRQIYELTLVEYLASVLTVKVLKSNSKANLFHKKLETEWYYKQVFQAVEDKKEIPYKVRNQNPVLDYIDFLKNTENIAKTILDLLTGVKE